MAGGGMRLMGGRTGVRQGMKGKGGWGTVVVDVGFISEMTVL